MLALALPVLDTLIVMQQRFSDRHESVLARLARMFNADKRHIHHILVAKYGSAGKAIASIWLITLLFATAAVMTSVDRLKPAAPAGSMALPTRPPARSALTVDAARNVAPSSAT